LATKVEAAKLFEVRFIVEAEYTTRLANVLVTKSSGKWQMCVNYTNLNKACPKDSYPLPNINGLANGAARNQVLSFLDSYS